MLRVKEFRQARSLKASQVITVVRGRYPGYDKYLNSKVENPEKYGIRLVNDAESLVEEAFLLTVPVDRKPDRRRLPQRIQCRISKDQYARLQQALRRDGYDTVQAGIAYMIAKYLEEHGS